MNGRRKQHGQESLDVEDVRRLAAGGKSAGKSADKKDLIRYVWARFADGSFPFVPDYVFDPPRRSAFDFALPAVLLAIEVEGVNFSRRSRHAEAAGYLADCEKYNRAAVLGWLVLRFTTLDLGDLHGADRAFDLICAGMSLQEARAKRHAAAGTPSASIKTNRAMLRAGEPRWKERGGGWLPPAGVDLEVGLEMVRANRFFGHALPKG